MNGASPQALLKMDIDNNIDIATDNNIKDTRCLVVHALAHLHLDFPEQSDVYEIRKAFRKHSLKRIQAGDLKGFSVLVKILETLCRNDIVANFVYNFASAGDRAFAEQINVRANRKYCHVLENSAKFNEILNRTLLESNCTIPVSEQMTLLKSSQTRLSVMDDSRNTPIGKVTSNYLRGRQSLQLDIKTEQNGRHIITKKLPHLPETIKLFSQVGHYPTTRAV